MNARLPIVLLAGLLVAGCASAGAHPAVERGIVVTGAGRIARPPDTAVLDAGVEARAARLADATAEVDRKIRAVLAQVKALGVGDSDIRTTSYAIDPVAEPRQAGDASARIVGYRVSNVVQIRTRDVAGVGRIVDAAVAADANVVRNVHFTLADPARAEAEARALAMQDAAARARQIAAAAGVKLGRLLSVTEGSPVRPVARMSLATAPGPLEPGQLEVTVSLEARYAIEP
ncbi:MAG TPA: SIMPL domain-containing protein [Methylomirabilota bacterium]